MKRKMWEKGLSLLVIVSLFLNFFLFPLSTVHAQEEATPPPTETSSPSPTPSETSLPSASPSASPTPTSSPTPTETPVAAPSPTPEIATAELVEGQLAVTIIAEPSSDTNPFLTTDKSDYSPNGTAVISGSGLAPQTVYVLVISSQDPPAVAFETQVTTDGKGSFVYGYQLDGNYRPNYKAEVKDSTGTILATTTFTDAIVDLTAATGGSAIGSATNTADGTATWTTLTGPTLTEGANKDIGIGTIILNVPAGFVFDTGGTAPTVIVTGDPIAGNNINGVANGSTISLTSITSTTLTITISSDSGGIPNTLTWQNVRVRPTAATPLATGDITKSGGSTYTVTGGATNYGTLTEVDTTPPAGTVSINSGATYTNSRNVTLGFASVSSDVTTMELGNGTSGSYQSPITYENPHSYVLPNNGDGTYTVRVRFTDLAGNVSSPSSDNIVLDTTPPVIATPDNITVAATSISGANVSYTPPTATDNVDSPAPASCTPASGSTFVIGTTTVTCTKTDSAGNTATPTTFTVTVNKITPTISWPIPADITYGTPLSGTRLNASSGTAGVFTYDPNLGAILGAGSQTLSATFTPDDTVNYATAFATNTLNVVKADALLSLSDLDFTYDGTAKSATVTTSPVGLSGVAVTYDGSATPPRNVGSYDVLASLSNPNYNDITALETLNIAVPAPITSPSLSALLETTSFSLPDGATNTDTPSLTAVGQVTVTIDANGSEVILPAGTIITRADGENLDTDDLIAASVAVSAITGLDSDMAVDGALAWGLSGVTLNFSQPITLHIYVGTGLNGKTLSVLRSPSGSSGWTSDGIVDPATCVVSNGICSFEATKASTYATAHETSSESPVVSASSGAGFSMPGAPVCTDPKPGSAPTLLSALAGANGVTLNWAGALGPVSYYLVAYGRQPGTLQFGNPDVGGAGTTSYTVKGLSGGASYYFKVRAGNGCTPGDYSNELTVTPGGGVRATPAEGFREGVLGTSTTPSPSPEPASFGEGAPVVSGGIVWAILNSLQNIIQLLFRQIRGN